MRSITRLSLAEDCLESTRNLSVNFMHDVWYTVLFGSEEMGTRRLAWLFVVPLITLTYCT